MFLGSLYIIPTSFPHVVFFTCFFLPSFQHQGQQFHLGGNINLRENMIDLERKRHRGIEKGIEKYEYKVESNHTVAILCLSHFAMTTTTWDSRWLRGRSQHLYLLYIETNINKLDSDVSIFPIHLLFFLKFEFCS